MDLFVNCGADFNRATKGKNWKTAGLDVQYCLEVIENVLFVHFQCSTSKSDWKHSFQFLPKRVLWLGKVPVYVHRGLYKCFMSAWYTVEKDILIFLEDNKQIESVVVDGHSFGGAMAIFSFSELTNAVVKYKCSFSLETWGAPKVFTGINSDLMTQLLTQEKMYECNNDLVTKVPPFYKKYKDSIKVGEKFNLFKMLFHMEKYHTCYGTIQEK